MSTSAKNRKKLDDLIAATKRPVAIFDLDGTIFDVTYRTLEILRRFANQPDLRTRFPEQFDIVSKLKPQDFHYSLEQTLNSVGIGKYSELSAQFLHLAETFWFKHFFTDELLAYDMPYAGAAACIRHLHRNGVQIVYLSGRDIPNMSRGTIAAIEKHGMPHSGHGVTICLKPAYGQNDLLFKKQSMETVQTEGDVILTIDNEPANVQLFIDMFPKAINVHFKTQYAQELELKGESLLAVKSFKELGFE